MMQFPLSTLLDEQACYDFLLHLLHPDGLACPHGHQLPPNHAPHDRHRTPIMDYRYRTCGAVFNLFSNTLWSKTRYRCSTIVLIGRGIAQGIPTKHLAAELGIDRGHLLARRHDIQAVLARRLSPSAVYLMMLPRPMNSTKTLVRKAANTPTLPTHPAAVPIKPLVMEPGTPMGQRLRVWLAVAALKSACRSVITAIVRPFSLWWKGRPAMMRRSTPMNGAPLAT